MILEEGSLAELADFIFQIQTANLQELAPCPLVDGC